MLPPSPIDAATVPAPSLTRALIRSLKLPNLYWIVPKNPIFLKHFVPFLAFGFQDQTESAKAINAETRSKQIARAFTELRCTFGSCSTIPDISVFTWQRIPHQENGKAANIFTKPPDWIIEIFSPNQSQTKITKNILYCLNYQTQTGQLIFPQKQSVFVYLPSRQITVIEQLKIHLPVP